MYKVLIVDDEEIIRAGLAEHINWSDLGFRLVGACADGREAIIAAERERPDVVLTDICMPRVDGLELAAWAADNLPSAIVIILSGYDEFNYAREALRCRVAEYLLKPFSAKDIKSLFLRLKDRLDSGRAERERNESLAAIAEAEDQARRDRDYRAALAGRLTAEDAAARRSRDPGFLPSGAYAVILAQGLDGDRPRDEAAAETALAIRALREAADGRVAAEVIACGLEATGDTVVAALARADTAADLEIALRAFTAIAADRLRSMAGSGFLIAVGGVKDGWRSIAASRAEAEEALRTRFLEEPRGRPVRWASLPADAGPDPRLRFLADRLASAAVASPSEARETVTAFCSGLRSLAVRPERADLEVRRLVFALLDAVETAGVAREELPALAGIDHTKPFAGFRRLEAFQAAMTAACGELARTLAEKRADSRSRRAAKIQRLIAERYADVGLSGDDVCAELGMSRSYLCKIMKRSFGMGFVEYLAGYRVAKAKELLRSTDAKLSGVAEAVGYTDQRYFGSIFKRATGQTPSEFRDAP